MRTTRRIIERLAKEYLRDPNYHRGWIDKEWIDRVTDELNLKNLNDLELSNMWDMVDLTLEYKYSYYSSNDDLNTAIQYLDVKSAFLEVVNTEARSRRGEL